LEDLRVPLSQELRHPLVGYAAGTQARGVRRPQVVDPEERDLGPTQRRGPSGLERRLMACPSPEVGPAAMVDFTVEGRHDDRVLQTLLLRLERLPCLAAGITK